MGTSMVCAVVDICSSRSVHNDLFACGMAQEVSGVHMAGPASGHGLGLGCHALHGVHWTGEQSATISKQATQCSWWLLSSVLPALLAAC